LGEVSEVRFQIKLWRSTLVTSILELDTAGRVVVNHNDKSDALYPPGKRSIDSMNQF
jgi:hypothetical protein